MMEKHIKEFNIIYIQTEFFLDEDYEVSFNVSNYNTLFFICWGPDIPLVDPISLLGNNKDGENSVKPITIDDCQTTIPYWYASSLPNNKEVGYICLAAIKWDNIDSVDTVTFKYGDKFYPMLIAIK